MALWHSARAEKKSVSPVITMIAIIALCAFIAVIGYINLRPRVVYEKAPKKSELTLWVEQKAAETGGDITKLSPEDRQKLQYISQGHGEALLKMLAPKKK